MAYNSLPTSFPATNEAWTAPAPVNVLEPSIDLYEGVRNKTFMKRRNFLNEDMELAARAVMQVATDNHGARNKCVLSDCGNSIHLEFPMSSRYEDTNRKTLEKARLLRDLFTEFVTALEQQAVDMELVKSRRPPSVPKTAPSADSYYFE